MARAAFLTPLYLSFSWVLTVSYQIFTNTAVQTVSVSLNEVWPAAAKWLLANIQTVSFVYAFSWIFLLTSVLPALLLGKERSVLVQYVVCLILTGLALTAENFISTGGIIHSVLGVSVFLGEPVIAAIYLVIPFAFMISVDLRERGKRLKEQKAAQSNVQHAGG